MLYNSAFWILWETVPFSLSISYCHYLQYGMNYDNSYTHRPLQFIIFITVNHYLYKMQSLVTTLSKYLQLFLQRAINGSFVLWGFCFCEPRKFYLETREGRERDRMLEKKHRLLRVEKGKQRNRDKQPWYMFKGEQEQAYKWFCSIPGTFMIKQTSQGTLIGFQTQSL